MMGLINRLKNLPAETWLMLAAIILLFGMLNCHGIWTQEYRWQQVCLHMLSSHDYWHPYLDGKPYYDKPLLSYWFIVGLAKLNGGQLNNFLLRLPAAIAGLITLWGTYWLGRFWFNREAGITAGWLLLSTFYFVFWARVASTDMLNIAAILLCIMWFLKHIAARVFWQDLIFFVLMAFAALLKGLIAPVLVLLILFPLLKQQGRWRSYLALKPILAAFIGLLIYLLPFIISSRGQSNYAENGLVEVFRENILRFFAPFDHQGPWYTYFIYFPVYVLPWTILVLSALWFYFKRWGKSAALQGVMRFMMKRQALPINIQSMFSPPLTRRKLGEEFFLWAVVSVFIFLSLSGSRRSYYILPIVPFAIILTSAWWQQISQAKPHLKRRLAWSIAFVYVILCGYFLIFQPYYYLHH